MSDNAPPLATLALALTIEDWSGLGLGTEAQVAPTSDLDTLVERVTALLLVRCVALVAPLGKYPDLSTSNICRTTLMSKQSEWPAAITDTVVNQLRDYVKRILKGYKDVPYHNAEHAFHVVLSMNKLMDLIVSQSLTAGSKKKKPPVSFGLRHDAMALLALIFSALIHDVEHQGIPNRQLALEDDRLAVLYNDQSIAENWSIYIGFSELLQDEFKDLRETLFPDKEDYHQFRKMVINLVLTTDIASPERTQLVKSKWKEAFGDPIETIERKMQAEARRMSLTGQNVQFQQEPDRMDRRGTGDTGLSDVSFDAASPRMDDSPSITPEPSAHDEEDNNNNNHLAVLPPELLASRQQQNQQHQQLFARRRSSAASRRSSTASRNTATSKYRQRLGILRTVDLSGETLENYTRSSSIDHSSHQLRSASMASEKTSFTIDVDEDEPDDLRKTVVMETLMQAADVAHNLQGWDHMVKFSQRLYLELRKSYVGQRGSDPEPRWFENQIGFLESYLLPLAHRLEDTGVFGATEAFGTTVEDNRDRWLTDGYDVAQDTVKDGAKTYPLEKK